ncbi:hypothetical protein [Halorubrum sp. F4]|uniref:hypothetical protein n=1 Tax=Halorubrum sp. F4 TaxID=2989715 RepID=UPI00247FBD0D|nr:hypothetical protein [Halorubrum sp. F4]
MAFTEIHGERLALQHGEDSIGQSSVGQSYVRGGLEPIETLIAEIQIHLTLLRFPLENEAESVRRGLAAMRTACHTDFRTSQNKYVT